VTAGPRNCSRPHLKIRLRGDVENRFKASHCKGHPPPWPADSGHLFGALLSRINSPFAVSLLLPAAVRWGCGG
jgi:hypothetical protein